MADPTTGNITSSWIKFFSGAGIPPSDAANYAIIFTDNRIQRNMLLDLTKEYLNDMGITVMGDIIAILKHAKSVHSQEAREKALKESVHQATPPPPRRSTPASRIIDHYIGNDPKASPLNEPPPAPKLSKEMASRLGPAPSKLTGGNSGRLTPTLAKSISQALKLGEGKYKVSLPKGTTTKTRKIMEEKGLVQVPDTSNSVFSRLGEESPGTKFTVTGLASTSASAGSSVFNRLGGMKTVKRAATSTSPDSDEDIRGNPLEYAGVLKSPPKKQKIQVRLAPKKSIESSTTKKTIKVTTKMPVQSEGIFSQGEGVEPCKVSVLNRLGKEVKVASASSTTPVPAKKVSVSVRKSATKTSLKARLGPAVEATKAAAKPSLRARLGPPVEVTSSTEKRKSGGDVFSRLGSKK